MISKHNEIEAKLAADDVTLDDFRFFMNDNNFTRYELVSGPDTYYEQGDNVVRHRMDRRDGRHELTVKRRKSADSTRDREEIDLHFDQETEPRDVDAFLKATGFVPVFTLVKVAHIYWLEVEGIPLTVVFYEVWQQEPRPLPCPILNQPVPGARRFIEVEAEKGADVKKGDAKAVINRWVRRFQEHLGVGEPLNESLYEIYSGKRYQSV